MDRNELVFNQITHIKSKTKSSCVKIILEHSELAVSPNQRFYLPVYAKWKKASKLQINDYLLNSSGKHIKIIGIYYFNEQMKLYDLTVEHDHNFFVSSEELLVHNEPCTLAIVAYASGKAAIITGYVVKTSLVGLMGYLFCNELSKSKKSGNHAFLAHKLQLSEQEKIKIK